MIPDDDPHDAPSEDEPTSPAKSSSHPLSLPQIGDDVSFSPSTLFRAFSEVRQRYALYYLQERDGRGTIDDMVVPIAAWENETTVERITNQAQKHTYSGLYHASLPKLEEFGFVTFDPETGTVTATDALETIAPYLAVAQQAERDAYERFLDLLQADQSPD